MAAIAPKDAKRRSEAQRLLSVIVGGPGQGRPQVSLFGLQPIQPLCLGRPRELWLRGLGQSDVERGVPASDQVCFIPRLELFQRKFADGLQHLVAWLIAGSGALPQQAVLDESGNQIEGVGRRKTWVGGRR